LNVNEARSTRIKNIHCGSLPIYPVSVFKFQVLKMKNHISIHIGEYYASSEPAVIHTVLGSCVTVCLFDPLNRVGGMNHILMPGKVDMKCFNSAARYGVNAMELLINRIMTLGGDRCGLVAKVFGGAHVISAISRENGMGRKNVEFAFEFLKKEEIRIISQDLGGTDSRKIFFHTDTGDVFLKRIPPILQTRMAQEEALKLKRMQKAAYKSGEITLFGE